MGPTTTPIVPQRLRNNCAMPEVHHLIIAYAAPPETLATPAASAQPLPALPALSRFLACATPQARYEGDPLSLTPPHEHALAQALGWTVTDGALPWGAWSAGVIGVACAWLWPCAWQASLDHITIVPPQALDIQPAESAALRDAFAAYAADDGITLSGDDPLRWLAQGALFDGWVGASLDRVAHRRADIWWRDAGQTPAARTLLRLLNEAQMLFHDHPVNAERAARGLPAINGLWISGAGRWDGHGPPPPQADVRLIEDLTTPATRGDSTRWAAAWQRLDETLLAPWLAAASADGLPRWLTLCGECGWRSWRLDPHALAVPSRRHWLTRWLPGRSRRQASTDASRQAWWSGL